jgi:hypothetical protein
MGEGLAEVLRSLVGVPCHRSLATNSLKLLFDTRESEKGRGYIWIDPPWRLSRGGRFITGSADWPVWDGVEEPEVNRPLWEAWCALFDPLSDTTLTEAVVSEPLPDLRLRFASGHEVQTFGNSCNGCWWYYRDRVSGVVFEAGAAGVTRELGEPAENEGHAEPAEPLYGLENQ